MILFISEFKITRDFLTYINLVIFKENMREIKLFICQQSIHFDLHTATCFTQHEGANRPPLSLKS